MKQVAPLRYGVIFKKAFGVPEIFTAFVHDFLNIKLEIDTVEKDKVYVPPIGNIVAKFDLYAFDQKNRVIVDMQHVRFPDHYHRFLHYHCAALLEQTVHSKDYRPHLRVFTLVILTSGDRHKEDISVIDFDPKNLKGKPLGEIEHKIIYICPKYLDKTSTPHAYQEWMEAIEDSLDEQVDESHYTHPEIQRIFDLIEKDKITPYERAKMFDEYGMDAVKQEKIRESIEVGRKEGLKEGLEKGIEKGREEGFEEGLKKGTEMFARNLLALGTLMKEQIAQATGLALKEVEALVKSKGCP